MNEKKIVIKCTECHEVIGFSLESCSNCGNDEDYIIEEDIK